MFLHSRPTPPPMMWAQRSNLVFLTICLEDCKVRQYPCAQISNKIPIRSQYYAYYPTWFYSIIIDGNNNSALIFLSIYQDPEINIEPEKLYFKGTGGTDKKDHEITINLYKEVDPDVSATLCFDEFSCKWNVPLFYSDIISGVTEEFFTCADPWPFREQWHYCRLGHWNEFTY